MYEVTEIINSEERTISFSLPCHDWCLLERSKLWENLDKYLEACQNTNIQMCQQEKAEILEIGRKE